MAYLEVLPENCPPNDAVDASISEAYRFVSASEKDKLSIDDFLSYAALGQKRPSKDPCALASCSLFESMTCKGFRNARKFPRLREKNVAFLALPKGSGSSKCNKDGHIHFWMYDGFDPTEHVLEIMTHDAA